MTSYIMLVATLFVVNGTTGATSLGSLYNGPFKTKAECVAYKSEYVLESVAEYGDILVRHNDYHSELLSDNGDRRAATCEPLYLNGINK